MRMNRRLLTSVALSVAVFGLAGVSHAQTLTVTAGSVTGSALSGSVNNGSGSAQIAGTTGSLSAGVGPLAVGVGTPISFTAAQFFRLRFLDSGDFGDKTAAIPFSITTDQGAATGSASFIGQFFRDDTAPASADWTVAQQATLHLVTSNGYYLQVTGLTGSNTTPSTATLDITTLTGTATFQGVIPEPATLALLGLGLAPVAMAIRRRRK